MPRSPRNTRNVRLVDIADRAGVSRMVVSRVLLGTGQGRIRVSEAKAEEIVEIAREMQYRPHRAARQLAGAASGVVGILAYDWGNYLAQRFLAALCDVANRRAYRVLASHTLGAIEPARRLAHDLETGAIDGLLVLAHENESEWGVLDDLFAPSGRTVCLIEERGLPHLPSVAVDEACGTRSIVDHLAARGYRRPVFVTEQTETPGIRRRLAAFEHSCRAAGLPYDADSVRVETQGWRMNADYHRSYETLVRELVEEVGADALVTDTDYTAKSLLDAALRLDLDVPGALAIVGWGNLHFSRVSSPTLTTIDIRPEAILSTALELLLDGDTRDDDARDDDGRDDDDPASATRCRHVEPELLDGESTREPTSAGPSWMAGTTP